MCRRQPCFLLRRYLTKNYYIYGPTRFKNGFYVIEKNEGPTEKTETMKQSGIFVSLKKYKYILHYYAYNKYIQFNVIIFTLV